MPLYEYQCHQCGKKFEVIEKFSDKPLTVHADCGGEVERLISAPSLQFKGSGWYVTDYGKGNSRPAGDSNGKHAKNESSNGESSKSESSKSETSKSESSKSETKTESSTTKTESKPA